MQEGVLLRLIEAMDLVDKEHGSFAEPLFRLGLLNRFAQILNAREDGGEGNEAHATAAREQLREGSLARARRAPKDQRRECAAACEQSSQYAAFADEMRLADEFREGSWSHALGQGSAGDRGSGLRNVVAKQAL